EQIQLTERLGFDEAWFAEHHHSDYGMLASPNLIVAALAHRTRRLRLGNLVNALPLHDPMRLAEECAMLDILTGGRLNVGLGRGAAGTWRCRANRLPTALRQLQSTARNGRPLRPRRVEETRSWSGIFISPRPTSRRGRRLLLRSLASGNWPPITSGAATLSPQ